MHKKLGIFAYSELEEYKLKLADLITDSCVSISEFGASSTSTDNTDALSRAFNSGKPRIFIPPGVYKHSGTIRVTTGSIEIFGVPGHSALLAVDGVKTSLYIEAASHVSVRDITLLCDAEVRQTAKDSHRIVVSECTDTRISNVGIRGSSASGIFVSDSSEVWINNSTVVDTLADGIHITKNSRNVYVEGNYTNNTGDDGIAVVSYRAQGKVPDINSIRFTTGYLNREGEIHLVLDGLVYGITITPDEVSPDDVAHKVRSSLISSGWEVTGDSDTVVFTSAIDRTNRSSLWYSDNGTGVKAELSNSSKANGVCENITISKNKVYNSKARGIVNVGGSGVIITGNIVDGTASSCYLVTQDIHYNTFIPEDSTISNNIARNAGKVNPVVGNRFGFEVNSESLRVLLSGNTAEFCAGRGFAVQGSGHIISDNRAFRNYGTGFDIQGGFHRISNNSSDENGEWGFAIKCVNSSVVNSGSYNNNTRGAAGVDNWIFRSCSHLTVSGLSSADDRENPRVRRSYEIINCVDFTLSCITEVGPRTIGFSGVNSDILFADGFFGTKIPTESHFKVGQRYINKNSGVVYVYNGLDWSVSTA